jgi:hypothetical protein
MRQKFHNAHKLSLKILKIFINSAKRLAKKMSDFIKNRFNFY